MLTICDKCINKVPCEGSCAALLRLREFYEELRTEERREIIRALRKELNIRDAETDDEMKSLGEQIIVKVPGMAYINEFDIKVGYVKSYERKSKDGRSILGECRKVSKIYGAYLPFDFIITFYEPNMAMLSEDQVKILMWHELKHIGIGDRGFIINPHDVEDFFDITDEHGTRWNEYGKEVADILK